MPAMVFPCMRAAESGYLPYLCTDATAIPPPFYKGEKIPAGPGPWGIGQTAVEARQQRKKKNREQFEANRPEYENSIRRLMERIQNTLLVDLQPVPEKSRQGKMMGRQSGGLCIWKMTVFFEKIQRKNGRMFL